MKSIRLFCSFILCYTFVLCYSGLIIGASECPEATLEEVLRQPGVPEMLLPNLSPLDIVRLGFVSHGMLEAVGPIANSTASNRLRKFHILNASQLDLENERDDDNQVFKEYVIQSIKDFEEENPRKWIKLNLSYNRLGNDLEFSKDLLHEIISTVHALKIDLTAIDLSHNGFTTLPEGILGGLNNLLSLDIGNNKLTKLPDRLIDSPDKLEELNLEGNELDSLPEELFKGLFNLKKLILKRNKLTTLPRHLFKDLKNLQDLDLSFNRLAHLREHLFKGLNKLQNLNLVCNQLTSLHKRLFQSLGNLQRLELALNELQGLPSLLFVGLNNLQTLYLNDNQLESLPVSLFEGLSKLKIFLQHNPLDIGLVRELRNRGFVVYW